MRNSLLIGLTVGTVMGMVIASKNRAVVQKVKEAEDAIKCKITEMAGQDTQQQA